jgi:hypothetical protein
LGTVSDASTVAEWMLEWVALSVQPLGNLDNRTLDLLSVMMEH